MTEHTPGPWTRDEAGFIMADGETIADSQCSTNLDIDEREANGTLIAAAPDLLEACKGIVDGFDEWEGPEEDILPPPSDRACCARNRKVRLYEAVQAAILKAEPLDKEAGDVVE